MDVVYIVLGSSLFWPVWIASTLLATYLGIQKGLPFLGFINGAALGPLGAIIVMVQDNQNRAPCPSCAEQILKVAKVCPHCQRAVDR